MTIVPFSATEQLVLDAVAKHASQAGTASGHQVRLTLLAAGLGKKDIGVTVNRLVDKGALERVRVVDAEGFFYMAYRQGRPGI